MTETSKDAGREILQVDKYLWLNLLFVFAYIFIAQAQGLATVPAWSLWALFLIAFSNAAVRSFLRVRRGDARLGLISQLFVTIDILLLSVGILVTSGLKSDLWLIYFIAMLSHSLYVRTSQVAFIAGLIVLSYPLATLPSQWEANGMPWSVYFTTLGLRLFYVLIIGTYTRRIWMNEEVRAKELQSLRERMATGEERARIAREIHDGLGHSLVSVILRLELCQKLLKRAPEEAEALLKEEIPALRDAWNEGRDLAFHLHPWESETGNDSDLTETLRRLVGRFSSRTGLCIDFLSEGEEKNLRSSTAFGLTRIVQEALTNAVKHANATKIEVGLKFLQDGGILCSIRDNGTGFEGEQAQSGFGLQAMRERAQSFGGSMEMKSSPSSGTEVKVTLPAGN